MRWLAPTLSTEKISDAADERENKVWDEYPFSEDTDPADVAEHAHDVALNYYLALHDTRWAVLAMLAAALYHLVEQQVCELCRLACFGPSGHSVNPKESVDLLKLVGIELVRFSTWPRIEELRHLANCVKHAEGGSCEQLRKIRPELFRMLGRDHDLPESVKTRIGNPLMGEDIYVSEEIFGEYIEQVQKFWEELADSLERIRS